MSGSPDILVIGSGMGGGALAYGLKGGDARVLVVERGERLPREPENWSVEEVFGRRRYRSVDTWLDRDGRPFNPGIHYYVGGNTKVYGAAMVRLRREDFGELAHPGGVSPAWPITYDELEPWYGLAEQMMWVQGEAGCDPTEPPRSSAYPRPPIAHDPAIARLAGRLAREGLHPFPLPAAIDQGPSGTCIRCRTCDGFPCQLGAKGDAETRCIDPALRSRQVTLRTGVKVRRLLTTPDGRRVDGVEAETPDGVQILRAGTVVVACGAVQSAALLLRSANARHPRGLANGSDQVGRNYMAHNPTALMAVNPVRKNDVVYQKSLAINDFYFGAPDYPWPMGNVQMLGKLQAGMLTAALPLVPNAVMHWLAERSVDWYVCSEDLPDRENRVAIEPDGQIRVSYRPNNLDGHDRLVRRLGRVMRRLGYPIILTRRLGLETTSHQCGTVRFGNDPATSVLGPLCRAWEVENLYAVDGGFFPSSAAVNPGLTIAAQALRVARHLLQAEGVTAREIELRRPAHV
jgi:choline dehydrogenase-like flavoprotein